MRQRHRIGVAQALRRHPQPAETLLWQVLRNRALAGFKFRRQHSIASYVVDFACVECQLVVELDGKAHQRRSNEDAMRTQVLESAGWQVLRICNTEVYDELEAVREAIYRACCRRQKPKQAQDGPLTPVPLPRR